MSRRLVGALAAAGLLSAGVVAAPAASGPLRQQLVSLAAPDASPSPQQLASAAYNRMTPAQQVGQLFMAGIPSKGATPAKVAKLRNSRIGNVILTKDSAAGRTAVKAVTSSLIAHQTESGVAPFISTDQEGGEVQRLTGKGFATMPTALKQGRVPLKVLREASTTWGSQLAAAGVDLDLAPVADTVPAKHAKKNLPIGAFDREFGHTPAVVAGHVSAFVRGMSAAGVDSTVKHFPGLGKATGNTDTTRGVTDPVTRHSPYIGPFQSGVSAGAQFVMLSSAIYPKIDPDHLACFSKIIIRSMLRGDLHFTGVVISDDFGTVALRHVPLATRAVRFLNAGGTMAIDTTLSQIPAMIHGVVAQMAASKAFAASVQAAVMTVLLAKANAHLISPEV
ncbi:MAG TPA: glycoside hydrolase family 3 N-terminal domain-containing protein [Mycobacteriales bacterium]|jgi:beta-N-acetylhexosaminidase|nr:glycoside hydrolase family 3 N-terminal domain-containing protein [Mycobacteriales bacterium]